MNVGERWKVMRIELFSIGCVDRRRLEIILQEALSELGIEPEMIRISDIA